MRTPKRGVKFAALAVGLALVAGACSDDDDGESVSPATGGTEASTDGESNGGGELIDLGTFVGDPPEHIDPALNTTLNSYQVINAVYDGLTDIDADDPDNPKIVPDVAESYEANDDATEWTFTIRDDEFFSDGEQVLPSSFERAWNRVAKLGGQYSYLLKFIDGGAEALESKGETPISGVAADDEAMTLTVKLSAPYANFDAVAGFQTFSPMPSAVDELDDQGDWENGIMIGNGPFKMESPRTDEEIVLIPNESWNGNAFGDTEVKLSKLTFRTVADPDTSFNALQAGEGDTANIPPGRTTEAQDNWGTTVDVQLLGSEHYLIKSASPLIGGPENLKLRQAIDQAIDRDEINDAVFNGARTPSTSVTPPGIPGYKAGLCNYCTYDPEGAKASFAEWTEAGNSLSEPIPIQFNADSGHEPTVQIIIDNLKQIGIEAKAEPMDAQTYFSDIAGGACIAICRTSWNADYPTYDNWLYDLFHSDSAGGNNLAPYVNAEFDALVTEAKRTVDKDAAAALYQQADSIMLNDVGAIPIVWRRGSYVYNDEKVSNFTQTNFGLILWERVEVSD